MTKTSTDGVHFNKVRLSYRGVGIDDGYRLQRCDGWALDIVSCVCVDVGFRIMIKSGK